MTVSQQPRSATSAAQPPHRVLWGLLRAARPKQWVKNVLVVAAPAAAGVLMEPEILFRTVVAFVCFCLVASGTYLLNDALDAEADRQHPRKRHRPIAAGIVPVRLALVVGAIALALGIGVAWLTAGWPLAMVLGVYVVVMQAYSLGMKRIAVIELAMVSSGFVLRAIAGGVAANVEISSWFLVVTSFASLFIVAGKRHGEVMTLGTGAVGHREALREYPEGFIQYVAAVAAAVAIMGYCLWSLLERRRPTTCGSSCRSSPSCSRSCATPCLQPEVRRVRPRRSSPRTAPSRCSGCCG